jgi:hypothetical protein
MLMLFPLALGLASTSRHVLILVLLLLLSLGAASPTQQMPLQIISVTLRDEAGNPITTAAKGQFIFVDIVVRSVESPYYYDYYEYYAARSFLIVARLTYGSPPTLAGLSGYRGYLAPGEQAEPTPGLQIPLASPAGTYTVTVLTFSDWPAAGGVAVAEPFAVSIPVS